MESENKRVPEMFVWILTAVMFSLELGAVVYIFLVLGWLEGLLASVFLLHLWLQTAALGRLTNIVGLFEHRMGQLGGVVDTALGYLLAVSKSVTALVTLGRDKTLN